ncbi:DUF6783 domain-containing protein [Blautia glucerasea]|uniref:DUF6783 domain-containing protein n=1 Tax=Blautia glucerasea TaxID=536633 RepID=UPI00296EA1EE|nr:DUF6783 domain-containing protein [Blautia glucerasea]
MNSVVVARYDALIRAKSPTNCDAHLAESLFQTRSSGCLVFVSNKSNHPPTATSQIHIKGFTYCL